MIKSNKNNKYYENYFLYYNKLLKKKNKNAL